MTSPLILPSSHTREARNTRMVGSVEYDQVFCVNCGASGGMSIRAPGNSIHYLCPPCGEKWSQEFGIALIPDEVMQQRIANAQLEEYGRFLAPSEAEAQLSDVNSALSKLARDIPR